MKHVFIALLGFFALSTPGLRAQGILMPQDSRVAPFPRPVPGPHPLKVKSLRIETRIRGQVATTRVSKVFWNDLDFPVDGVYFYPLPEDAALGEFAIWEGEKRLRGEVLEKEEARQRYLSIVRQCWDPGLLEYAGANLFQARVFPVPARGEKRIELVYSQLLKSDHGLVSYAYPLLSGTRANPQPVGTLALSLELETDRGLKTIYSPTHTLDIRRDGDRLARATLELRDTVPDRHFQLFYSSSEADFGLSLMTYRESGDEGYFMILLSPKVETDTTEVIPKDIVFVLDTSGSMQERGKFKKALSALRFGIRSLNPEDRFNIVAFSSESRKFDEGLAPAGEENRSRAIRFLERQSATGGTNIHDALRDAIGSFQAGDRPRYLVFLTDGLPTVGETDAGRIVQSISAANAKGARLFTFGVGYDVNTFLLDQLAGRNHGAPEYVTPDEDLEVKLSTFFAKLSTPVMTSLELDLDAIRATDIYPRQLPDLFKGSQITVLGRYSESGSIPLSLRGLVRGRARTLRFDQNDLPASSTGNDFLPRIWAMRKVGFLLEQIRLSGENPELKNEVVRLAKKYGFVTPYTSYLAMDEKDLISRGRPIPLYSGIRMAHGGAVPALGPPAAAEAVEASVAVKAMKTADVVEGTKPAGVRQIGSKSFVFRNDCWTDTAFDQGIKLPAVNLRFGSDELLRAIAGDRDLAAYASLGPRVIVVHKGRVYRIGV